MKAIVSADELAKDVAGAEALLERHQEHTVAPGNGTDCLIGPPPPDRVRPCRIGSCDC